MKVALGKVAERRHISDGVVDNPSEDGDRRKENRVQRGIHFQHSCFPAAVDRVRLAVLGRVMAESLQQLQDDRTVGDVLRRTRARV